MKPVEYYAFWFHHRIDLKEYLEKYYSLKFNLNNQRYDCLTKPTLSILPTGPYENTWYDSSQPSGSKTQYNINLTSGNVLDWECIENDCPPVEAIPHVLKNINHPLAFKTAKYKRIEHIFKLTATRYRLTLPTAVEKYLDGRQIDHNTLKKPFSLGSPIVYQILFNYLNTMGLNAHELTHILTNLSITPKPSNYRDLPQDLAVVVPVYTKNMDYIGFHGRRINPGSKTKYFNTGFLKDFIGDVLYGEERAEILAEIKSKNQVILTKSIFDFFHCYQDKHKQVLSTLNQGISAKQFDRVMAMPVKTVVVGFSSPKSQLNIIGLMHTNLKKAGFLFPKPKTDISDAITQSGETISSLIAQAKQNMAANNESIRIAAVSRRNKSEKMLIEEGKTFLVEKSLLLAQIKESKGAYKCLKTFVFDQRQLNQQTINHSNYVRIPQTFVVGAILDGFKAELRLLLFLMAKANPSTRTVSYTNKILKLDLDISETTLLAQKQKLKSSGYLLDQKKIKQSKRIKRRKMKRSVHFIYYPSLIKFVTEDPNAQI